eukprot:m.149534 g.149534  ORF g.149534 m.149534 type:complete len:262 (-) comp17820_c0_seq1:361-1146(-)
MIPTVVLRKVNMIGFHTIAMRSIILLTLANILLGSAENVLWLPLGDSITWGCGTDVTPRGSVTCAKDAGGYRVPLAWALSQAGHNISTMGTLTTGPPYVPEEWTRHEGHPGWRFDQIDQLLNTSLKTSTTPPSLITIHLGTNDCGQGVTEEILEARAISLLNHILAAVPTAKTFIASMIGFPAKAACADTFNAKLPSIVDTFKQRGMKIVYTPMQEWSGVCVGNATAALSGLCCSGQVHPTAAGYLRMASAFALSIAESGI